MALVLTILGGVRAGESVEIDRFPFRMGRAPDNHLALSEFDHISSSHAEIVVGPDGRPMFRDLGSTNGSAVRRAGDAGFLDLRGDQRRVEGIGAGDEIHLGDPAAPLRLAVSRRHLPQAAPGPSDEDVVSSAFDAVEPQLATMRARPPFGRPARVPPLLTREGRLVPLDEALDALEYAQVREALVLAGGDPEVASGLLEVSAERLAGLLERMGLA